MFRHSYSRDTATESEKHKNAALWATQQAHGALHHSGAMHSTMLQSYLHNLTRTFEITMLTLCGTTWAMLGLWVTM